MALGFLRSDPITQCFLSLHQSFKLNDLPIKFLSISCHCARIDKTKMQDHTWQDHERPWRGLSVTLGHGVA